MTEVFSMIAQAFTAVSGWLIQILNATGASGTVFGAIFIFMLVRFLLAPVFIGAGSDRASKDKGKEDQ